MQETDLSEIEVEEKGRKIRISKQGPTLSYSGGIAAPPASPVVALSPLPPDTPEEIEIPYTVIPSPIVGTFYKTHAPGAEPYVQVGDVVKKGQTLCIVEAMKLMNEIESELDGTIVRVCVEDKSPVEFGQPLFHVAPLS